MNILEEPGGIESENRLLVGTVEEHIRVFYSVVGLKVEKLIDVVIGKGKCGDTLVENAGRERRSLDILSAKKETKRSASEEGEVVACRGDADLW